MDDGSQHARTIVDLAIARARRAARSQAKPTKLPGDQHDPSLQCIIPHLLGMGFATLDSEPHAYVIGAFVVAGKMPALYQHLHHMPVAIAIQVTDDEALLGACKGRFGHLHLTIDFSSTPIHAARVSSLASDAVITGVMHISAGTWSRLAAMLSMLTIKIPEELAATEDFHVLRIPFDVSTLPAELPVWRDKDRDNHAFTCTALQPTAILLSPH